VREAKGERDERRRRYWRGHLAEWVAAAVLIAKGHRILARRQKTPAGEIDLIAVRGNRIAFVEVKRRLTLEDAQASITELQRQRIRRAADLWLARHPGYQAHEIGFDLVFLVPRRWPSHIENGL
jgi:putative endonuclease